MRVLGLFQSWAPVQIEPSILTFVLFLGILLVGS